MTELLSEPGGLVYHLRALRYRRRLWQPFRETVAGWLRGWQPPCERLLLIGPSAGHTLPDTLFDGRRELVAIEPDPLARLLLRRRTAGRIRFDPRPALDSEASLSGLADAYPDTALLFCNVLGQLEAPAGARWAQVLQRTLSGQPWASYHDVVSTTVAPRPDATPICTDARHLEAVLAHFWRGGELPLVDHQTFALNGPGSAGYALWPLMPGRFHLIEWTTHSPRGSG